METIGLFIILFLLIPFGLIVWLIIRVVKKSTEKKSVEFLQQEYLQMRKEVEKLKSTLTPWQREDIKRLSNTMKYQWKKTTFREFKGTILSSTDQDIVAFKMIDRGLQRDCQMVVCTRQTEYFIRANEKGIAFQVNGKKLGYVTNQQSLLRVDSSPFGRLESSEETFSVYQGDTLLATIKKNSDRRTYIFNPFYDFHHMDNVLEQDIVWEKEVEYFDSMIEPHLELDEESYQWVMSIALFDIVYNGLDFTL